MQYKKGFLIMASVVAMVLGTILSNASASDTPQTAPQDFNPKPVVDSELISIDSWSGSDILIVHDLLTWGMDISGDAGACQQLNITYNLITSASFTSMSLSDLNSYKVIMLAADQDANYYNTILGNKDQLQDYVSGGGVLVANVYMGWVGYSTTQQFLPGGVILNFEYSEDVDFLLSHYLVANPDRPVSNPNTTIDNMSASSSYYFTNLPLEAVQIAQDLHGHTVIAEYPYGGGTVLAVGIAMEWFYRHVLGIGGNGVTENNLRLLYNEIEYALKVSIPPCVEKSFTDTTLFETLLGQQAVLDNVVVSGDFDGTLNFTNFEIVSITTGPFAGKGFSKGEWEATLGGISYTGDWKGAQFLKPQEGKIYLKGAVSGEISATVEGYLTETVPGSGTYDQYQATWKIGRLGGTITSATINLNGTVSYQSSSDFPAVELYVLQTNIEGPISGHYSGDLSIIITHLRVTEETNPYWGEGFSIVSYVSESGSGEGWTYDNLVSPDRVKLKGLFTSPLFGIVSATLDESELPRTLFLNIERVDLGLPPMADLEVTTWGPGRVSPGQTISYVIEYRNDGVRNAEDVVVVAVLPSEVEYISSTGGGIYRWQTHEVVWKLGTLLPKSGSNLTATVRVQWGLPWGSQLEATAIVGTTSDEMDTYLDPEISVYNLQEYLDYQRREIVLTEDLQPEQLTELLLSDPGFKDLYDYAYELGFVDADIPTKMILNDGSVFVQVPMFSYSTKEIIFLLKLSNQNDASILLKLNNESISLFNRNNGFIYNGITDEYSTWGEGHQSICTWRQCMKHCIRKKLGPYLGDQAIDALLKGLWGKVKRLSCYAWAVEKACCTFISECPQDPTPFETRQEYQQHACERAPELFIQCLKSIPIVGEIVELEECIVDCIDKDFYGKPDGTPCEKRITIRTYRIYEWENCEMYFKGFGYCENWPIIEWTHQISECKVECKDPRNRDKQESAIAVARDPNIKYGPEGYVQPGQTLNYEVEFENEGEGIAFGVYITDVLDEDLDDLTLVLGGDGTYNPSTRTITWFVGEVGPGEGGSFFFSVNVRGDAPVGTDIINFATVYFPSVPEITRTNGIVSIIPLPNSPPIANAGPDQTVSGTCPDSTEVTLDGIGSSDPDNDPLTFTWRENGNPIAGPTTDSTATVILAFGTHTIELTVDDGQGETDTDQVVIDVVGPGYAALSGFVIADSTEGLLGVNVDVYDSTGALWQTVATDDSGYHLIDSIPNGDYTVSIMTPLGYQADQETQPFTIYHCPVTVDYELTKLEILMAQRGRGYWMHQVNALLSGKGDAQESYDDMCNYMELIRTHFNEHQLNPVNIFSLDLNSDCPQRLEALRDVISPKPNSSMNDKAKAHLTNLLLNMVSGKIAQWAFISEDSATVSQAITYCNVLITDTEPENDETAKDIAEMINEGQVIPAGMIDLATPDIAYKQGSELGLPTEFSLSQNFPNPFNPITVISFALPEASEVKLEIYNIVGQKVATLVDGQLEAGEHIVRWDGRDVASGVYLYRLEVGEFVETKKMILLK